MSDPRARIVGQAMHRDLERNFSFWRPRNWRQDQGEDRDRIVYYPEEDPRTGFYVLVRELGEGLGEPISDADLPDLHAGILEGLQALPECHILSQKEIGKESAIGLEFLLTFDLDGETCKRRMRMLYKGTQQFTIYGQGVPAGEYDVFANVFDWMYLTFTFGDLLEQLDAMHPSLEDPSPWAI